MNVSVTQTMTRVLSCVLSSVWRREYQTRECVWGGGRWKQREKTRKITSAAGRSTRAWTTEYELRGLKSRQRHEPIGHPKDETTPYRGQLVHVDGLEHTLCGEERGDREGSFSQRVRCDSWCRIRKDGGEKGETFKSDTKREKNNGDT